VEILYDEKVNKNGRLKMKVTITVDVDWNKYVSELGVVGQSCAEDVMDCITNLVDSGLPISQQDWVKSTHVSQDMFTDPKYPCPVCKK
tara:strand:- start:2843 stop:3106 length:264 start_codon:yes stop_codon:yes gene_type:complete